MRKNQQKTPRKTPFSLKKIKSSIFVLGVDEAGRGAWAGPVVAACVAWIGRNPVKSVLRDSKKMTAKEREKTYGEILLCAQQGKLVCWVGIIENTVIDTVGIREANRQAMEKALHKVQNTKYKGQSEGFLLIDWRDNYSFNISDLPIPEYIIRGDSKVKQIMAASILAKVTRDRIMIEYERTFPWYAFEKHKGYGTEMHQESLKKLGVSEIHRKSYEPISLLLSSGI